MEAPCLEEPQPLVGSDIGGRSAEGVKDIEMRPDLAGICVFEGEVVCTLHHKED